MTRIPPLAPDLGTEPCVSVVMPVFNEGKTIHEVVAAVLRQPCVRELVIVDDCSSDNTWSALEKLSVDPRVKTSRHEVNQGKGAALRTAIGKTRAPLVLIQDADLEYDPGDYARLIQPILSGEADVVFGSRFLGSEKQRSLSKLQQFGNRALTVFSNLLTRLKLTDMETCYKVFRREIIEQITIEEDRFGFEPEITAKVARLRARIREVAISYSRRSYEEGKKIGWKDGVSALRCILKYSL